MFFPDCSTVIQRAPRLVVSAPRLVVGALRLVASAPRCSQACGQHSQVLPGAPGGHCIGPVNSGIWPPWDSGPTTLRHSQRLPVTKIFCWCCTLFKITSLIHLCDQALYVWSQVDTIWIRTSEELLCLWYYRYISGIILDHSMILIWIFDPESRIITRISVLDLLSILVHQLVISPLPDLHINRSTTAIWPTANMMCMILGSMGLWDLYC